MARSKNRRKNGKIKMYSKANAIRSNAKILLQDVLVCNCIDLAELNGDRQMTPRTLTYNKRTGKAVALTTDQAYALKYYRWNWDIKVAILCRKQDGEVYITRDEGVYAQTEVKLEELNGWLTETLIEKWKATNPMHALSMLWYATPYDNGYDIDLQAMLCPVWYYQVLGNMLTQWEMSNADTKVYHYRAKTLDGFMRWFKNQKLYRDDLQAEREIKVIFKKTSRKMAAGELKTFKAECQKLGLEINVTALPHLFDGVTVTAKLLGHQQASLIELFNRMPKCIAATMMLGGANAGEVATFNLGEIKDE